MNGKRALIVAGIMLGWLGFAEVGRAVEVGFADTDLTPDVKKKTVYIAGFGQNRKATGVREPLLARAIVLRDGERKVALVSVDLVGLFRPQVLAIRKRLPTYHHILVSSTHTHEGPDTLGLWGPTPFQSGVDPEYLKLVEERVVQAIQQAESRLTEATAQIGQTKAPELLHDSREPDVKHDDLVVLFFRAVKTNKPLGFVVQWNCHPETLDSKTTELSADYVPTTLKWLRERYHCPGVYFTGTVGGLMTSMHVKIKDAQGKVLPEGSSEKTDRYGVLLAEAADRALKQATPIRLTPLEARTREVYVPMDNKLYLLARQLGVFKRDAYLWNDNPYQAELAPASEKTKRLAMQTEVGWLRLGELEIAAIPGEIYPELVLDQVQDPVDPGADYPGAPIEPAIYKQLRGKHRMLIGLANDEIGYILPKRQWDEQKPFCYQRKKAQYGETNSVGPETAPILCKAFAELLQSR